MSALPIHSEGAFRKYERHLAAVVQNHPMPTRFQIDGNINTFIARIRDAINGMRLNNWQSKEFSYADCQRIFRSLRCGGDFVFTQIPGGVYCGPPLKDNGLVQATQTAPIEMIGENEFDARDEEIFDALLLLKQRGYLDVPLKFRNVTIKQTQLLEADEFIEFFPDNSGAYVMI